MNEEQAKQEIQSLTNVSRETMEKLEIYAAQLEKWNPAINLVSKTTLGEKWRRHFLDSAQLWQYAPESVENWADIGAGAGFPGLVLATIAAELRPDINFTLIESDVRKSAFLRNTARAMAVTVNVKSQRIESVDNFQCEVLSARALAPLEQLIAYAGDLLSSSGSCLFLKGQGYDKELALAAQNYAFDSHTQPSITSDEGQIVIITGLKT